LEKSLNIAPKRLVRFNKIDRQQFVRGNFQSYSVEEYGAAGQLDRRLPRQVQSLFESVPSVILDFER
jgi:hypothetical protein